jgi:hypothetical protein
MHDAVAAPSTLWKRVAPVAGGCALAGAAVLVALNDPAKAGSGFPACQFRAATGLWCPGCGLTRGFHQLFNGNLLSALQHNLFVPVVLIAVVAGWWWWLRTSWGRQPARLPTAAARWVRPGAIGLVTMVVVYGVLRNIPVAPFPALAP